MKSTKFFLVALAVSAAACDTTTRPAPTPAGDPAVPSSLDAEPPISWAAGALARSLASADARLSILAAMRASTQVEHQLILGDYLRSPEGAGLLAGSAAALGMEEAELLAQVARLDEVAELVISVPLREHRLAWRGTPHIGVAGSWDPDALDFAVHEPAGRRKEATKMSQVEGYDAFFYVHPRESWGTRIGRQADGPGVVIQDPDDGETAIVWTHQVGDRPPVSVDYGRYDSEGEVAKAVAETLGLSVAASEVAALPAGVRDPSVTHSPSVLHDFRLLIRGDAVGTAEVKTTLAYTNVHGTRIRGSIWESGVEKNKWHYATHSPYRIRPNILPVSPKLGGVNFAVAAVETDWGPDQNLGREVFSYAPGGRMINLRRITVDLRW